MSKQILQNNLNVMCLKNDINSHNDNRFEKKSRFWVKSDFGLFFEKPKKRFDKNYKK